jgi:hypothetical protein
VSIQDAVHERLAQKNDPRLCKLGVLTAALPAAEADALSYAVNAVRVEREGEVPPHQSLFTVTWLADVLKTNGHDIGKTVVSDHVRKVCVCESSQ